MKTSKHELDPKNAELIEEVMNEVRKIYSTLGTERVNKNVIDLTIRILKDKGIIKEESRSSAQTSPKRRKWTCPRCHMETKSYPGLSRRDNKTEICEGCAMEEAMFDFKMFQLRDRRSKEDIEEMRQGESAWLK